MSKDKKEVRAAKRAKREAADGKKVIGYVAGALLLMFILIFVAYTMV